MEQRRVASAGDETDAGIAEGVAVREPTGIEVGEDVVVAHDRQAQRRGDRLTGRQPHQQRADEAGPDGHRHCLEVGLAHARPRYRLVDDGNDPFDMGP